MSRKDKARHAAGSPPELNNPFAGLQIAGLPPGPDPAAPGVPRAPARILKPGRVVLRRETAHRGGKVVIVIDDFAPHLGLAVIEDLARRLRHACGCGGTVRRRGIELQGDQPAKIRAFLEAEGFTVAGIR